MLTSKAVLSIALAFCASIAFAQEAGRVVAPPVTPGSMRYGIPVSEDYQVQVNGQKVPVYTATICRITDTEGVEGAKEDVDPILTQASFLSFDFEGAAHVVISTTGRSLEDPVVRPLSAGVKPRVENNTLVFELKRPANLMLELGREKPAPSSKASKPRPSLAPMRPLFVFANPIEAVPKAGASIRYFGPGVHNIGHLVIKSGQTLYLDAGAVLNGTLFAEGAEHIKILGRGILDGSGTEHYKYLGIDLHNCKDVVIDGIIIRDSPHWAIVPTRCEDVTIRNVKILNWRVNGDGIDPCNSHRVLIDNCFIYSSDDAISVKGCNAFHKDADEWSVEDIKVSNSTLMTGLSAFGVRIGNETRAPEMKNLLFQNLDFYLSGSAFAILAGDRAVLSNIVLRDSRIERYFGWVLAAEIDKGKLAPR